jgi:protocatechuate 3,4-dioxygenase beta subunit
MDGPFYPPKQLVRRRFPHADNDLCVVPDQTPAEGLRVLLGGRLKDLTGGPVPGVRIEIWQTCHRGRYLDPLDDYGAEIPMDPGFQYFGECLTDDQGTWAFRTVMPRRYPSGGRRRWWRPAHVHFKLLQQDRELLTTQLYFDDPADPDNAWKHRAVQEVDRVLRDVPRARRGELICRLGRLEEVDGLGAVLARHGPTSWSEEGETAYGTPRAGWFAITVDTREERADP